MVNRIFKKTALVAPSLIISLWIVVGVVTQISHILLAPFPETPWEAAMTLEAVRFATGLPVFENPETGHATHMYGSLYTAILGSMFWLTEPSNITGRILSLICALGILVLVLVVGATKKQWMWIVVGSAMLAGIHLKARGYFVSTRPDMLALFTMSIALIFLFRALEKGKTGWLYVGLVATLAATFLKQTMAPFALVPVLAHWLARERQWGGLKLGLALVPAVCVTTSVLIMAACFPDAFFYMVSVPKQYPISPGKFVKALYELIVALPVFLIMLWDFSRDSVTRSQLLDPVLRWIVSCVAIAIPVSAIGLAKAGGTTNSLLPALLSITLFCVWYGSRADWMAADRPTLAMADFFRCCLLGFLLWASFQPPNPLRLVREESTDSRWREWPQLVSDLALLQGRVVSPKEPTLTYFARGQFDRNIYLEYDAVGYPEKMPQYIQAWLSSADYIIDAHYRFDSNYTPLSATILAPLGFIEFKKGASYTIFRKSGGAD